MIVVAVLVVGLTNSLRRNQCTNSSVSPSLGIGDQSPRFASENIAGNGNDDVIMDWLTSDRRILFFLTESVWPSIFRASQRQQTG
jgi:hypothetical protein